MLIIANMPCAISWKPRFDDPDNTLAWPKRRQLHNELGFASDCMLRTIRDAHFARAALGTLISSLPSQGKVGSWVVQKIFPATEAAWREALLQRGREEVELLLCGFRGVPPQVPQHVFET